jgi:hypothetical protein
VLEGCWSGSFWLKSWTGRSTKSCSTVC